MGIEDQPNASLQAENQKVAGRQATPAGPAGADPALPPGGPTSTDMVTKPDGPEGRGTGGAPDVASPSPSPTQPASGTAPTASTATGPQGDPLVEGEDASRQGRDADDEAVANASSSQVEPSDDSGHE